MESYVGRHWDDKDGFGSATSETILIVLSSGQWLDDISLSHNWESM